MTVTLFKSVPRVDNWSFKLFTVITPSILLALATVVSLKQFLGQPIHCDLSGVSVVIKSLLNVLRALLHYVTKPCDVRHMTVDHF